MIKKHCFYMYFRPLAQWIRAQAAPELIAFVLLMLMSFQATAATRQAQVGTVTRVVDGDTLWVKTSASQQPLKVRIQGIDAPEICQPGGDQARDALKGQVLGQSVTVTSGAHDDYGRTIGSVHLQGQDMGRWQVAQGHAWVYSYRARRVLYADEFAQAQAARRGVFSGGPAEEPRLFRRRHGSCRRSR
ncbi:MAG: thermonuclease family protein [Polaromonas sp.]